MKLVCIDVGGAGRPDTATLALTLARERHGGITWLDTVQILQLLGSRGLCAGASWPMADLWIAPAGVEPHGYAADLRNDVAAALSTRLRTPVLRVRSSPLAIRQILMLVDGTAACMSLPRPLLQLGLWPRAEVNLLPLAKASALCCLPRIIETLHRAERSATVLPELNSNFEMAELEGVVRNYQAAVTAHLWRPVGGYFGAVRNDPFAIIAENVPLVLVSSG